MLELDKKFPEVDDISELVIKESDFNPAVFKEIESILKKDKKGVIENPYAASKHIIEYASEIGGGSDVAKLEKLASRLNSEGESFKNKLGNIFQPKCIGEFYDDTKIETRNASELFEYSRKNGEVPLVCLEHTLLVLALGNSMGLNVGAADVPTMREVINGKDNNKSPDKRREHIVPIVYVKNGKGKYSAVGLEIVSYGDKHNSFIHYPDSVNLNWADVVFNYINNLKWSKINQAQKLYSAAATLDLLLSKRADTDTLFLTNMAFREYEAGNYAKAVNLFNDVDKQHELIHGNSEKSHAKAKFYSAMCYYNLGEFEIAISKFSDFFPSENNDSFWNSKGKWNNGERLFFRCVPNIRGVEGAETLGEGMALWGDSILRIAEKEKRELSKEEFNQAYFLMDKSASFGFVNLYMERKLVEMDFKQILDGHLKLQDYNSKGALGRHVDAWKKDATEIYNKAISNKDKTKKKSIESAMVNFIYNNSLFHAKYLSEHGSQDPIFINNLRYFVLNDKLKNKIENEPIFKNAIGEKFYNFVMTTNVSDTYFDLKSAINKIIYL